MQGLSIRYIKDTVNNGQNFFRTERKSELCCEKVAKEGNSLEENMNCSFTVKNIEGEEKNVIENVYKVL